MSSPARWVWHDLMTFDADAAAAFYGTVLGWTVADSGLDDRHYRVISLNGVSLGGMLERPRTADGAPPASWLGYIASDNVDAGVSALTAAGGHVHHAPDTIPEVGRFAVVADPQGAAFTLFAPARRMAPLPPPTERAPGHVGWTELHTSDPAAAFDFYAGQFGWTKAGAVDMGPMGTYQMFATGGEAHGGMMRRAESPAFWLFYFNVPEIKAAATAVSDAGGAVLHGPHEVPGGSWVLICNDPQGAAFALVSPPPSD